MNSICVVAAATLIGGCLSFSVAVAGPAWADDPNGSYTQTVVDGAGHLREGATSQVTIASCGPGCLTELVGGQSFEYQLQGDDYVLQDAKGPTSINKDTLVMVIDYPNGLRGVYQLTKNG